MYSATIRHSSRPSASRWPARIGSRRRSLSEAEFSTGRASAIEAGGSATWIGALSCRTLGWPQAQTGRRCHGRLRPSCAPQGRDASRRGADARSLELPTPTGKAASAVEVASSIVRRTRTRTWGRGTASSSGGPCRNRLPETTSSSSSATGGELGVGAPGVSVAGTEVIIEAASAPAGLAVAKPGAAVSAAMVGI